MKSTPDPEIRVLIIAGDDETRASLLEYFKAPKYQPTTVEGANTALRYLSNTPGYDVALLDVSLPAQKGFDLLEAVKSTAVDTPVLIITNRNCLEEKLQGFQLGADDYVVKPYAMEELEARVHAVLRRQTVPAKPDEQDTYTLNDLKIDFTTNTCFREERRVALTSLEFSILEYLVEHRGQAVSREELRDAVWTDRDGICLRTIDRHVAKIREKLEQDPNIPAYLQTVYGKGYEFACAEYA